MGNPSMTNSFRSPQQMGGPNIPNTNMGGWNPMSAFGMNLPHQGAPQPLPPHPQMASQMAPFNTPPPNPRPPGMPPAPAGFLGPQHPQQHRMAPFNAPPPAVPPPNAFRGMLR